MQTVKFEHMVDGTPEDYDLIGRELAEHKANHLTDHILDTLKAMAGPLLGYQVDRFPHCLQSATRALRNGEDDEMVVAALLHDVGAPIAPENHSAVAADILRPYVSDRPPWVPTVTLGRPSGATSGSTTAPRSARSTTRTASSGTTTPWRSRSSNPWCGTYSAGTPVSLFPKQPSPRRHAR